MLFNTFCVIWHKTVAYFFHISYHKYGYFVGMSSGNTETPIIETQAGPLQGIIKHTRNSSKPVYTFLGVPYAQAPVGSLRFQAPQPVKPWKGVKQAKSWGKHTRNSRNPVYTFLVVPYAQAHVGSLRFQAPQPVNLGKE